MKFEAGLRDDIQFQVSFSRIRTFSELVDRCRRADDCCRRMTNVRIPKVNAPPRNFDHNLAPQGCNFKNNTQSFHNFNQGGGNQNHNFGGSYDNQRPNNAILPPQYQQRPSCSNSGKFYGSEPCRFGSGNYYNCGKLGHIARDCKPSRSNPKLAKAKKDFWWFLILFSWRSTRVEPIWSGYPVWDGVIGPGSLLGNKFGL
ncbi:hypothetical protein PIB30_097965 [Stylosanthes scabra]|uniref:CCHC-type domain-containing protein n=1 Tax=Stylosanthes scabra TaxID=79078 RepID=A0ABU6ZV44_9FABA|nr:hypothetical protein [Stylosanthes scabra]